MSKALSNALQRIQRWPVESVAVDAAAARAVAQAVKGRPKLLHAQLLGEASHLGDAYRHVQGAINSLPAQTPEVDVARGMLKQSLKSMRELVIDAERVR